jgi:hypothetical protein
MAFRLLLLVIVFIARAHAADSPALRAEFQRAYESADESASNNDSAALRGYILYPYLVQQRLHHSLAGEPGAAVDQATEEFLKTHGTDPVARELRRTWYASLAKR